MKTMKKIILGFVVLVLIGGIAEGYNTAHHLEMAESACGTKENIARYDSTGFECKSPTNKD